MSKQTVPCHVDMSNTSEFLYAHVDLSGVQVGPGDQVLVHDPIVDINFDNQTLTLAFTLETQQRYQLLEQYQGGWAVEQDYIMTWVF